MKILDFFGFYMDKIYCNDEYKVYKWLINVLIDKYWYYNDLLVDILNILCGTSIAQKS